MKQKDLLVPYYDEGKTDPLFIIHGYSPVILSVASNKDLLKNRRLMENSHI